MSRPQSDAQKILCYGGGMAGVLCVLAAISEAMDNPWAATVIALAGVLLVLMSVGWARS